MVNFSLEAQRDSFPSLGPDDDEDDEDVVGRPDNVVFGHGGAACNPKCPLGFSNQGPQPLRSLGEYLSSLSKTSAVCPNLFVGT